MKQAKQKFITLATIIVLLNGIMLVSCQKESVTETVKTQKTEVSANERTAGSTWTYGEPAYYDEFGLPRWNENYPKVKEIQLNNMDRKVYYYDPSDLIQVINTAKKVKINQLMTGLYTPCRRCGPSSNGKEEPAIGVTCDCGDHEEVVITANGRVVKKTNIILLPISEYEEN